MNHLPLFYIGNSRFPTKLPVGIYDRACRMYGSQLFFSTSDGITLASCEKDLIKQIERFVKENRQPIFHLTDNAKARMWLKDLPVSGQIQSTITSEKFKGRLPAKSPLDYFMLERPSSGFALDRQSSRLAENERIPWSPVRLRQKKPKLLKKESDSSTRYDQVFKKTPAERSSRLVIEQSVEAVLRIVAPDSHVAMTYGPPVVGEIYHLMELLVLNLMALLILTHAFLRKQEVVLTINGRSFVLADFLDILPWANISPNSISELVKLDGTSPNCQRNEND